MIRADGVGGVELRSSTGWSKLVLEDGHGAVVATGPDVTVDAVLIDPVARDTIAVHLDGAVCGGSALAETRTWTDAQGRQVVASFVRIDGGDIVLQTEDGGQFQFALSKLSAEDQELAKGMAPAASPDAPPVAMPPANGITGFP